MTSSMRHDLERGSRLEARWLSGGVGLAEEADVDTPLNRAVADILSAHADGRLDHRVGETGGFGASSTISRKTSGRA